MFEEMALGADAALRARAVFAAIALHLTIVFVAAHSTRDPAQPMTRRIPDTVRIELPRAPTTQTAAPSVRSREQFPVVPSAPAVPPLRLEPPRAGSLQRACSRQLRTRRVVVDPP